MASALYSIKDRMCVYYIGMSIGFFPKEKLEAWIDAFIEKSSVPIPGELIEVALLSQASLHELVLSLDRIFRFEYQHIMVATRVLLGMFCQVLKNNVESRDLIISFMQKLMRQIPHSYQMSAEYGSLCIITDYYELARDGIYSSVEQVIADALQDLQSYEQYVFLFNQ